MEFQRCKRRKHTAAAPPRLVELTLLARFSSPWRKARQDEVRAIEEKRWHPTENDFAAIAMTPNKAVRDATTTRLAGTVDEFIARICYLDRLSRKPRLNHNLGRVNLISHGGAGVFALSGEVHTDGRVLLGRGAADPKQDERIDERTLEWFNTSEIGRTYRNMIREKLHSTAELWLILCNGAGLGKSYILAQELANTLAITVRGYSEEVWCHPDRPRPGTIIRCPDGIRECVSGRNTTSVGERGAQGRGYSCWVKVPDTFAGKHMSAAQTFPPKNIKD